VRNYVAGIVALLNQPQRLRSSLPLLSRKSASASIFGIAGFLSPSRGEKPGRESGAAILALSPPAWLARKPVQSVLRPVGIIQKIVAGAWVVEIACAYCPLAGPVADLLVVGVCEPSGSQESVKLAEVVGTAIAQFVLVAKILDFQAARAIRSQQGALAVGDSIGDGISFLEWHLC
jgi:hypothetical protein